MVVYGRGLAYRPCNRAAFTLTADLGPRHGNEHHPCELQSCEKALWTTRLPFSTAIDLRQGGRFYFGFFCHLSPKFFNDFFPSKHLQMNGKRNWNKIDHLASNLLNCENWITEIRPNFPVLLWKITDCQIRTKWQSKVRVACNHFFSIKSTLTFDRSRH